MAEEIQERRWPTGRKPTPEFTWEDLATATLPVFACFLGGATEKWAEGIVVALLGLLLMLNPPRFSLRAGFHVILLAILAWAAVGFLPANWFYLPAWRQALVDDFGVQLPRTLSAQPWVTGSSLLSLFAGLCWLYYVTGQEVEIRAARRQLRIFAVGLIFLAGLAVALHLVRTTLPFWHNQRAFGPFPNRNQTANLFGLASIVIIACGHDEIRRGKKGWLFWLAGLAVMVTALILNFSRAGIGLLIAGSAIWLAVLMFRSGSAARIAIGASTLLALLTALLLFGGPTFERFNLHGNGPGVAQDPRWLIFQDTAQLIRVSPVTGVGLGNFESVFPIFRNASANQLSVLHPESDWLWLGAELGAVGIILVLAGVVMLGSRVFPFVEGTNQWFRLAALIAAMLFIIHGMLDVGGHRVGTAYAGIFLFALALRRPFRTPAGKLLINFFRVLGFALVVIGLGWVVSVYRGLPIPGTVGVDIERHLAISANVGRQFKETIAHANNGLQWAPLDWQLYFLRALGKVGAKRPVAEALEDFRRARFLEPDSVEVPYQEGLTWLTREPTLALTAWREALRRAGPHAPELYSRMFSSAAEFNPAMKTMLEEAGLGQSDLTLTHLERTRGPEFDAALQRVLVSDPDLASLKPDERAALFEQWADHGDLSQLAAFLDRHPEMLTAGWRGAVKQKVRSGDFRGAYELTRRFGVRPALPELKGESGTLEALQRATFADPNDYQSAFALYQRQVKEGKTDDALTTLRRVTERPGAPAFFHFLEAEAWAAKSNWERAWKSWQSFDDSRVK